MLRMLSAERCEFLAQFAKTKAHLLTLLQQVQQQLLRAFDLGLNVGHRINRIRGPLQPAIQVLGIGNHMSTRSAHRPDNRQSACLPPLNGADAATKMIRNLLPTVQNHKGKYRQGCRAIQRGAIGAEVSQLSGSSVDWLEESGPRSMQCRADPMGFPAFSSLQFLPEGK